MAFWDEGVVSLIASRSGVTLVGSLKIRMWSGEYAVWNPLGY